MSEHRAPIVHATGAGRRYGMGPIQAAWIAAFSPWAPPERILAFQVLWHVTMLAVMVVRGLPFLRGALADVAREPR